jgi:hypothetical protein
MIRNTITILLLAFLSACNSNYGDVVVREKVQVFYLTPITLNEANRLADYWMEKELATEKTQYLQLSKAGDIIQLKLVANDSSFLTEISFEIQLTLYQLDSMLRADLYPKSEIQLLISDKQFDKTKALQ